MNKKKALKLNILKFYQDIHTKIYSIHGINEPNILIYKLLKQYKNWKQDMCQKNVQNRDISDKQ